MPYLIIATTTAFLTIARSITYPAISRTMTTLTGAGVVGVATTITTTIIIGLLLYPYIAFAFTFCALAIAVIARLAMSVATTIGTFPVAFTCSAYAVTITPMTSPFA